MENKLVTNNEELVRLHYVAVLVHITPISLSNVTNNSSHCMVSVQELLRRC